MSHLGRRISGLGALIPAQQPLLLAHLSRSLGQVGHGGQIKVGIQVPEEGAGDSNQRSVRNLGLAALHRLHRLLVDDDLVVSGLDQTARRVLELLARLDEEVVPLRDLDGDAVPRVAGPDVQTRVARAAVDGQEVEIRVETSEYGVLFAVLGEV